MGRAFEEALPILLAYLKSSRPSLPLKKAFSKTYRKHPTPILAV